MTREAIRASVIVAARDAQDTLPRMLECLQEQDADFPYEVIVVDDGSSDRTPQLAESAGEPVRLLRQDSAGPAAARNRGVAEGRGATLAFCDADCFPTGGWLSAGVRALETAELAQGKVLPDPTAVIGPFDRSLWIDGEGGLWETANLFVTRELFERVGGFEDWLEPVAGKRLAEDVWFGWRAKRLGARSAFCPEALVHHAVFGQRAMEYVGERTRRRHFPEIVKRIPELRRDFLWARLFLNRRTAALDAALVGGAAALAFRRTEPLAAIVPYLWFVGRRARWRWYGAFAAKVAAADVAADLVSAWALLRGSVNSRCPVL